MKTSIILTTFLLIFGCSNKDSSKGDSLQTTYPDTLQTAIDRPNEQVQYIGFLDKFYFSNDDEVYIELYFIKDETNAQEYNEMVKLADSLIYQDDENSRYKFPENLSAKYFDLRGLSKLKIYDNNNKLVCNAEFLRVEYLDQNISSPFIAVYKTEKKIKADSWYGITNYNGTLEQENHTISTDTAFTQNILTRLNEQKPYDGLGNNGTHMRFSNKDTVLSVINSENYAYIVLTTNADFQVLYKSPNFENIIDLRIIPLTKNKLPYILTRNLKPETDVMWDKLLYYNGTKYIAADRQRIE